MSDPSSIFTRLMAAIEDRKAHPTDKSYTATLLAGGLEKIGAKIREETDEIVQAAGEPGAAGRTHTIGEAADCLYHLFVLLAHRDIPLVDLEAELERRFGTSGLEEKASRATHTPKPGGARSKPAADSPHE